jgi:hypothetical protein
MKVQWSHHSELIRQVKVARVVAYIIDRDWGISLNGWSISPRCYLYD